jgi:hypothetical protein
VRVIKFIPHSFDNDGTYFHILEKAWERGESFINVEHDIIIPDKDPTLAVCPNDWCAAPYPYLDRPRQFGLGCVKFSDALIARHQTMFEVIGTWYNNDHPPKHWCTLDSWTYIYLIERGEKRCENHELVGHEGHPGKMSSAHGCLTVQRFAIP